MEGLGSVRYERIKSVGVGKTIIDFGLERTYPYECMQTTTDGTDPKQVGRTKKSRGESIQEHLETHP